ncbi:MAG TPA: HAD hydrolase family protein [Gemmatimonadaceae bacterium]|nr:HAD hydrolase family protein [Gemmatimonadaceae bacterium]
MIRLVCIDVDGTLVGTAGVVAPAVWDAAARARAAGIHLAICSGRPAFGITGDYARRLDPAGWHVFQNGASVVHLPTRRSLSARLADETVAMLVERARVTGRVLELYTDTEYAVESTAARARAHAGLLGVPFAPRPFDSLDAPIVRAQWLLAPAEGDAALAEPHPGLEVSPSTSPVMPDTLFVNLTPAGVDKATAVRAVSAEYGVPLAQVMFVGDGWNDAVAMRMVGCPVAMANADPAALAAALRTVGHVDDGGLAEALEMAVG